MGYYERSEVSNSDLGWLQSQLYPKDRIVDPTEAYANGNLLDAMITEPEKVDYFKRTRDGVKYKADVFKNTVKMKQAFWKDEFCNNLMTGADGQKISIVHNKKYSWNGIDFELDVRCKWDIWRHDWKWGGDIKSTAAKTQTEFEAACKYFNYDRQRAWYMDIEGSERDVLIGISKVNHKVFKIFINRDSEFYKSGKEKYLELAFKYYILFK
jgi:hypothetical protein